jgi:predicted nucleic acid-binding protein
VTTDEVLGEFLNALSGGGRTLRSKAVEMVQAIMANPNVTVIPQSRASFRKAVDLYGSRPDKHYSLVDCSSMDLMRAEGLQEVLTNDHHFSQEGFTVLIAK